MLKFLRPTLAAALLAGFAVPCSADETPAMRAFYDGVTQLQAREWKAAEVKFREAIKLKPDYAEAYNKLGQSLFNEGRPMDAITELKNAVAIDPRDTEAWYNMGFSFENIDSDVRLKDDEKTRKKLAKTKVADAEAAYEKALAVQPGNDIVSQANSHFRLGVLQRDEALKAAEVAGADPQKTNLKSAMDHLEEANALIPDFPEARNELGRLYDAIGRYPEAIEQYSKAILGHRRYAEAYSNRGVAWWKAGNWDKALEDTLKATEIDPKFAGGHYNFAEVVFARVQELRLKGDDGDRSVIHLEAQKAVDEYRVATELDPDFMAAWYGLAKAYRGYHDYDNATKIYQKILDKDKRQKKAKLLIKELVKEQKAYESHIPKQYRDDIQVPK